MTLIGKGDFRLRFHRRTHHADIPFGAWCMCLNGIQFFVGQWAISINWPLWLHRAVTGEPA